MYEKPLPAMDTLSQPFWEGVKAHQLMIQQCQSCHHWIFYPRVFCLNCNGQDLAWKQASGEGTIYSYTICRRSGPAFQADTPYAIALIDLKEGPRMLSQVVCDNLVQVTIGKSVSVIFDDVTAEITLPKFALA